MKNILTSIAKANVGYVSLITSVGGLLIVFFGILLDINEQIEMIKQSYQTFQNYLTTMELMHITSVFKFVLLGVQLKLPSVGSNLTGIGVAIVYVGTFLSMSTVYLARHFTGITINYEYRTEKYFSFEA